MAKKLFIGNSNLANRVYDIYIGVNNVARRVLKGYIGVDGKARQFYNYGKTLTGPSYHTAKQWGANCFGGGASIPSAAAGCGICYGGLRYGEGTCSYPSYIAMMNDSLTVLADKDSGYAKYLPVSGCTKDYGVFAGGSTTNSSPASNRTAYVIRINASGTVSNAGSGTNSFYNGAGASTNIGYASGKVFYGTGQLSSSQARDIDTVDNSGTLAKAAVQYEIQVAGASAVAHRTGGYAFYAGGVNGSTVQNYCVAFHNTSNTKTVCTNIAQTGYGHWMGAGAIGQYVLFLGGSNNNNTASATVSVYNKSLTRSTMSLGTARWNQATVTLGSKVISFGGYVTGKTVSTVVDMIDRSLVRSSSTGSYGGTKANCFATEKMAYFCSNARQVYWTIA